jgi:ABC-type multidrug transport system fused ATPase/permease subunit
MRLLDRLSASLAPTPDDDRLVAAAPSVTIREVVRRFWPIARRHRWPLAGGIALAAVLPAVEVAEIWLFKLIVDDVLVAETFGPLAVYVPLMFALAVLGALLSFGDEYAATWVGEKFVISLRERLLGHLQRLEPDAFDRLRHGDVLSRLTSDVHAIETLLLSAVAEIVQAAARLLFFAGALALLSWKLALASLIVVPGFYVAAKRFARLARRAARERRRRSGSLTAVAEESLANAALVQSANAQEHEMKRFRRESEGAMAAELAGTRIAGLFAPVVDLIQLAGAVLILVLGTWALTAGELTIGGLLAFLAYLSQLYRPIRDLSQLSQRIFEATAGAERVIELLDTEPRVREHAGARPLNRVYGQLELDDVTYRYPGSSQPALDGVSLVVQPGRSVAVVGASGAGKSTLAKLALRFADPDRGTVRLDGHDLRDLTLESLREHVALLLQEAPLFDGTVRENVAYGRTGVSDADITAALAAAAAAGLADELPDGMATRTGQRGRALSGGQRRRVAMARALLQDAPVLVLDEPSSGLDALSTRRLLDPLRRLMRDRATLLITHDLELAAEADEIVVLDAGRVVERGSPADLDAQDGSWARLRNQPDAVAA